MEPIPPRKRIKKQRKCVRQEHKRIDFVVESFSKELVLKVFSFLSLKDLMQCAAVSLQWFQMANDEMLWKPLFIQRFRDPLYIEDNKTQLHYKRRTSVSQYNGSWKKKYRVHHNWLLGNCFIHDIVGYATDTPHYPKYLQFAQNILFTAEEGTSIIKVWSYDRSVSSPPRLINQLQSIEQPNDTQITFLKLDKEDDDGNNSIKHLIAGYSNGGFTLWQVLPTEVTEIADYIAAPATHMGKVISIGMELPIVLLYTENGKLCAFRIDTHTNVLQLVHQLQTPMSWFPVAIDIHKYTPSKKDVWKALLCFGVSGGNYTTTVGMQEIILSVDAILSSRHAFALNAEPIIQSDLVSSSLSDSCLSSVSGRNNSSEEITAMAYSPPHLITAHANNTMKHYLVTRNRISLDISFKQTLYGHTFRVDALAIDASNRRLVSGDRSGIKIWDLTTQSGECQISIENYANQSDMNELPDAKISALGFDEDKIVAIMSLPEASLVRLWSFDT